MASYEIAHQVESRLKVSTKKYCRAENGSKISYGKQYLLMLFSRQKKFAGFYFPMCCGLYFEGQLDRGTAAPTYDFIDMYVVFF